MAFGRTRASKRISALIMTQTPLAVVILAAGQGTRMKSTLPKVLHKIGGRPMLGHVLAVARALGATRIVVVTAPGADSVAALAKEWGAETVVQDRQLGTGHAVLAARAALGEFSGNVLILFGDAPLLTASTLGRLVARLESADIATLGFRGRRSHRLRPHDRGRRCARAHRRTEGRKPRRTENHARVRRHAGRQGRHGVRPSCGRSRTRTPKANSI